MRIPLPPFRKLPPCRSFFPTVLHGNIGVNPNRIVPRSLTRELGGFAVGMPIFEDWHFWYRVALAGRQLNAVDYVGCCIRRNLGSCLRSSPVPKVVAGHVRVLECLTTDLLSRPVLLEEWGEVLFWSAWVAYHRARRCRLKSERVQTLARNIREIARRGPIRLQNSRFAKFVRFAGVPTADFLRHLLSPKSERFEERSMVSAVTWEIGLGS